MAKIDASGNLIPDTQVELFDVPAPPPPPASAPPDPPFYREPRRNRSLMTSDGKLTINDLLTLPPKS